MCNLNSIFLIIKAILLYIVIIIVAVDVVVNKKTNDLTKWILYLIFITFKNWLKRYLINVITN